jgi:1-acyl-sn-glycerol-3-phosphate acyltransferase
MAPREETDSQGDDTGKTVELTITEPHRGLPSAPGGDLRSFLPGLEAERQVTDWGRSERVEWLVDRTIYDFLYHYWFRVEVEGIENVPARGGALLVANHAGTVPPDGAMIAKAIREEHPHPRAVHLTIDRFVKGLPALGMLATKVGGVLAHPANLHRLLFDEQELVLVFPEGRTAAEKPLKERYRLRRFDRGGFAEAAVRAGAPIVPIAVLGAEEAQPQLARLGLLRRLTRLRALPITTPLPLPAKVRIRFLEPIEPDLTDRQDSTLEEDVRALIQENLLEMVAERRSVWLG